MVKKVDAIQTIDASELDEKAGYNAKTEDVEIKAFSGKIFHRRLNPAKLARANDLNTVEQVLVKNEESTKKLQAFNSSYFLGKIFSDDESFQNKFVFQPTFSTLVFKKDKRGEYVISSKSKGLFKTKLFPLYGPFLA